MRTTQTATSPVFASRVTKCVYTRTDTGLTYPYEIVDNITMDKQDGGVYTKDPDWKVLVSKRRDASGAYFRRRIAYLPKAVPLALTWYWPAWPCWVHSRGTYVAGDDPTYPNFYVQEQDDSALKDTALGRLKQKLSSRSNQMNLVVPVVELREFRDLIKTLTFLTTDLVQALVKAKRTKSSKAAFQFFSHAWLNYSFAAAPMLGDIKQLASTINDVLFKSGGEAFTDYGVAKKVWNTRGPEISRPTIYGGGSMTRFLGKHDLSYRFVAGYTTPLRSANDYNACQDFSLELGVVVPALWELTAFSWLGDYFSTFGAYLDDTFISDTTTTFYVNCTKKYSCSGVWVVDPPKGGSYTGTGGGASSRLEWSVIDRQVYAALPKRALRFKTSDEIGKNAMNKLLNLGSILVGGRALSNKF